MLDIEQIIYVSIFHQELIMEIDQSNIEVASGSIVPSKCGELAFRVVKKVRSETESWSVISTGNCQSKSICFGRL